MADEKRGIRRIVELVLDRVSARRVKKETQKALDEGTDPRKPVANVKKTKRALEGLTKTAKNLVTVFAAIFGARVVGRAIGAIFKLGSAVEETASKFSTVFGEAAEDVQEFIDNFANMAGLSGEQAQAILGHTGAIAQGFGFAKDESADLAMSITALSADLASFHNLEGGTQAASMAVINALAGEREQIKKLGIVLREEDVVRRAFLETGKKRATQLTQLERVTASLSLITEKAGVAVGDLERTQDSAANTSRRLIANLQTMKEEMAFALLPVMSLIIRGWVDMEDGMTFAGRAARFLGDVLTKTVAGLQIISVRLNAFFRTIPAQFKVFVSKTQNVLLEWLEGVEQAVNFLRRIAGAQEVDFTSGLRESVERLRSEGEADIVAFRILVEDEIAKIVAATKVGATVVNSLTTPKTPTAPGGGGKLGSASASRSFLERGEGFLFGGKGIPGLGEKRFDFGVGFAAGLGGADQFGFTAARLELEMLADDILNLPAVTDDAMGLMESSVTSAVFGMTDAFATGFEAILGGMSSLPKAAVGIGLGIVAGLVGGMAQYHEAQAVGKLAEGTWPPNPAAIKSAIGHLAAAGLFRALGALASKGQANLSGGARGGAGSIGAVSGRAQTLANQGDGQTTFVFIDPFNPDNPLHYRQMYRGWHLAREEYGDQIPIDIRRGGPR